MSPASLSLPCNRSKPAQRKPCEPKALLLVRYTLNKAICTREYVVWCFLRLDFLNQHPLCALSMTCKVLTHVKMCYRWSTFLLCYKTISHRAGSNTRLPGEKINQCVMNPITTKSYTLWPATDFLQLPLASPSLHSLTETRR